MRVRYTAEAQTQLAAIIDYLRHRNTAGAMKVAASIRDSVATLSVHPYRGRQQTNGARKVVTLPYAYIVYYGVSEDQGLVPILSIQHPAQGRAYQDR